MALANTKVFQVLCQDSKDDPIIQIMDYRYNFFSLLTTTNIILRLTYIHQTSQIRICTFPVTASFL